MEDLFCLSPSCSWEISAILILKECLDRTALFFCSLTLHLIISPQCLCLWFGLHWTLDPLFWKNKLNSFRISAVSFFCFFFKYLVTFGIPTILTPNLTPNLSSCPAEPGISGLIDPECPLGPLPTLWGHGAYCPQPAVSLHRGTLQRWCAAVLTGLPHPRQTPAGERPTGGMCEFRDKMLGFF